MSAAQISLRNASSRVSRGSGPLAGKQFCLTSVREPVVDELMAKITEMGGSTELNLVRDTNCLIVGSRWSEKYNYVLECREDILVISPRAFDTAYERWVDGEVEDSWKELQSLRMPTFERLRVCLADFPLKELVFLNKTIEDQGGLCQNSIPPKCHLLVTGKEDTEIVKAAKHRQIPVVFVEWVIESLQRRAAWSPELYLADKSKRKKSMCSALAGVESSIVRGGRRREMSDAWDSVMRPAKRLSSVTSSIATRKDTSTSEVLGAGLFAGVSFYLHGFDKRQREILCRTIESHNGTIRDMPEHGVRTILNSDSPSTSVGELAVTEWALERSIHKKTRLLDDVWGTPVVNRDLHDFAELKVCVSGFSGVELLHLTRLIPMLGAEYCETLTAERDILVSTSTGSKVRFAQDWGVPIVSEQWLWKCAQLGRAVSLSPYLVDGSTSSSIARLALQNLGEEAKPEASVNESQGWGISYDDEEENKLFTVQKAPVETLPAMSKRRRG